MEVFNAATETIKQGGFWTSGFPATAYFFGREIHQLQCKSHGFLPQVMIHAVQVQAVFLEVAGYLGIDARRFVVQVVARLHAQVDMRDDHGFDRMRVQSGLV